MHADRVRVEITQPTTAKVNRERDAPSASGAQPIKERGWVIAVARDASMFVQGHRFEKTAHTSPVRTDDDAVDTAYVAALGPALADA